MSFPASRTGKFQFPRIEPGKAAALALLILLLAPSLAAAWDEELATKLAYQLQWDKGVVIVLNHRDREYGTGWFIDPRYVVTAKHVIGDQNNNQIEIVKGSFHAHARIVAVDGRHDIAILELDQPYRDAHIFPLKPIPRKAETIYVIGYPGQIAMIEGYNWEKLSMNPRATRGSASWYDEWLIEVGTYTDAGNSGGPVVDEDGNAVGLITYASEFRVIPLFFATSAEKVIELCQRYNIPYVPANESMGAIGDIVTHATGLDDRIKYALLGAGAVAIAAIAIPLALARRR